MFSPGRLLTLGAFALLIYMGFYAVPGHAPQPADFDPEVVARHEAAIWQSVTARSEFATTISCILYQRELHRMSWFRAVESGMALSQAVGQCWLMTGRYDRAAPRFEQVAAVERAWKAAAFDPMVVARHQVTWMALVRDTKRGNGTSQAVGEMSEEMGLRFGLPAVAAMDAAANRAPALHVAFSQSAAADWDQVALQLTHAYTSLQVSLARAAGASAGR